MEFIETSVFTKLLEEYLNDEEYTALQCFLVKNPEAGDVIKGSIEVRKVRWAKQGKGKRDGIRVIYFFKKNENEIWMLTLYGKNEKSTIPDHILRKIAGELKNE